MGLTKEQARENRCRIVETASRMFRLGGIESVSVGDVMKEAGFTHGGFYNHFKSKDDLAIEAIASAFDDSAKKLSEGFAAGKHPRKSLDVFLVEYLSAAHRDTSTGGCPASAFPIDAARNGQEVQAAFADGIESYLDILAAQMNGNKRESRQQAITLLSGLVGALLLSRAVKQGQPRLSDEFLNSVRKQMSKVES